MKGFRFKLLIISTIIFSFFLIPSAVFATTPDWYSQTYEASLSGTYPAWIVIYDRQSRDPSEYRFEYYCEVAGDMRVEVQNNGAQGYNIWVKCSDDSYPDDRRQLYEGTWYDYDSYDIPSIGGSMISSIACVDGDCYNDYGAVTAILGSSGNITIDDDTLTCTTNYFDSENVPPCGTNLLTLTEPPAPFDFSPTWADEYQIFFKNTKGDYSLMHSDEPMCFETVNYSTYPYFKYDSEVHGLLTNTGTGWLQSVSLQNEADEKWYQPNPYITINDVEDFSQYELIASSYEVQLCSGGEFLNRADSGDIPGQLITEMSDFRDVYDTTVVWDCDFDFGTFSWLESFAEGVCRITNKGYNLVADLPSSIYNLFVPPPGYFQSWASDVTAEVGEHINLDFSSFNNISITDNQYIESGLEVNLLGETVSFSPFTDNPFISAIRTIRPLSNVFILSSIMWLNYKKLIKILQP